MVRFIEQYLRLRPGSRDQPMPPAQQVPLFPPITGSNILVRVARRVSFIRRFTRRKHRQTYRPENGILYI